MSLYLFKALPKQLNDLIACKQFDSVIIQKDVFDITRSLGICSTTL